MANNFSKEERVAFEDILQGFDDALVISRHVNKYGTDGQLMERANDTIWRPQPYIMTSQDRTLGSAVTAQDGNQLSVPATLGYKKNVTWNMTATDLRDALQEGRLGQAAYQRLASDINTAVRDVVSTQGTLVVTGTAGTYDYSNVAECDSVMNEQGIMTEDRYLAINSRDNNGLAGVLAGKDLMSNKSLTAWERAYLGMNAGFETYKIDSGYRLAAELGATVTVDTTGTTAGDTVKYVPTPLETTIVGQVNHDNRYQTISITTGVTNIEAAVQPGDAFTIAGVYSVHHITKESTGQLKTFRVISIESGTGSPDGTIKISPAIVGAVGTTVDAEEQYKNVSVETTSATAAVTFLNSTATNVNPFWYKDSIEILPGRYAVPEGQGVDIMRGTTPNGLEVVMSKKFDNSTFQSLYTLDVLFGVVNTNPEMNGILMWV